MRPCLFSLLTIAAMVAGGALPGCDSAPPDPRAKPGLLIGKLSDPSGKPLKNVTVSVSGFTRANEPVTKSVTIEGPATEYSLALPDGTYGAPTAQITLDYNEQSYTLPLAPADNLREWLESRDSRKGLVRDFVWRISGARPGTTSGSKTPMDYWGGTIQFDKQGDFGDYAKFEVTLTPDGPLMDGSQGKPLTFVRTYPWASRDDHLLTDIPLGRYTATVKLQFGSKPKLLRVVSYTIDPTNPDITPEKTTTKAKIDFEMQSNSDGTFSLKMPNLVAFPSS